jgi:hypothetical protein
MPAPTACRAATAGLSCRIVVRPEFRCRKALVRDVSSSAITLVLDEPLPEGAVMALQLAGLRPGLSRVVGARAGRATPEGGRWLVECSLTWPFTEDEVRAVRQAT